MSIHSIWTVVRRPGSLNYRTRTPLSSLQSFSGFGPLSGLSLLLAQNQWIVGQNNGLRSWRSAFQVMPKGTAPRSFQVIWRSLEPGFVARAPAGALQADLTSA